MELIIALAKIVNFSILNDKITIEQFNNVTICY